MRDGWKALGACVGSDPDLFVPWSAAAPAPEARALCAVCAVRDDCLEYGLLHDIEFGIYGGLNVKERRALRVERGLSPTRRRAHASCGSDAGYAVHRRRHEEPCGPCRAAHAAAQRGKKRTLPRWDMYDECATCRAPVGSPCRALAGSRKTRPGEPMRSRPHDGRRNRRQVAA